MQKKMTEQGALLKCKVKLNKVFLPKNKPISSGDFAIFTCEIVDVIEGEPRLSKYGTITCKGTVPALRKEEVYELTAREYHDGQWGYGYQVVFMGTKYLLETPEQKRLFLNTILTDNQVKSLYLKFKDPFSILESGDIESLIKVKGIKEASAQKLINKYNNNIDHASAYIELNSLGLTKEAIDKLVKIYHNCQIIIEKIKENPYFLMQEIDGYGWKRADAIALKAGIDPMSPQRIGGYIQYFLEVRGEEGNSFSEPQHIFESIQENIGQVEGDIIRGVLYELFEKGIIWWDEEKTKICLTKMLYLERSISKEILRLINADCSIQTKEREPIIKSIEAQNGWEFTDEQIDAVEGVLKTNVSIVTGGAGVGKTSAITAVLQCLENASFAQVALAGRAAARMSEATGEDGCTIHRLLGYKGGEFTFNGDNKLPYDVIILDEVSMVGGELFLALTCAIKDGAKLIMLGDVAQLESIGFLNLFHDMMDSGVVSTFHLNKIHRQAEKSAIITTSMSVRFQHQIFNRKYVGNEIRGQLQDLELDIYEEGALTQRKILKHYKKMLDDKINPSDILVVVPVKIRGDASVFVLNPLLQKLANPMPRKHITIKKYVSNTLQEYHLKEGDKVINTQNCYKTMNEQGEDMPVYNGNIGTIVEINTDDDYMIINFQQWGRVIIEKGMWSIIELGYAISCHRAQGSQAPYVIVGIDFTAYVMLTKEWLYTAISRAEKYCVLCGVNSAIATAIETTHIPHKQTFLKDLLQGKMV